MKHPGIRQLSRRGWNMMSRALACALSLSALAAPTAAAPAGGGSEGSAFQVTVGSVVTPHAVAVDLRMLPRANRWRPGDPIREIPESYPGGVGEQVSGAAAQRLEPFVDPVRQSSAELAVGGEALSDPQANIAGLGFTGFRPPDVVGDVGPTYYIGAVNASVFAIWRKSDGAQVVGPTALDSLWTAGGACANGGGDPIVIYDELADRWQLSEFASSGNHLCIYMSQTNDPVSGGWFLYDFPMPAFPDYPQYGVWSDGYYVSTFEGGNLGLIALQRDKMLTGSAAVSVRFTVSSLSPVPGMNIRTTRILPGNFEGTPPPPVGAPNIFARPVEALQDQGNQVDRIEMFEFDVDWNEPSNSSITPLPSLTPADFALVPCSPGTRDCIAQHGSVNLIDALSNRAMRSLQYRNFGSHETLLLNQTVDAGSGQSGIRWYELRKSGGPWSIHQQGTYAPGTANRWMGSIAMNGDGDIGLGFSITDPANAVFPSIGYTGRRDSDAPGTLRADKTLIQGTGPQTSSQRWGDYSGLSVDPSDDATFWYVQEYTDDAGRWQTQIGSFGFTEIFIDGFESGDTSAWSTEEPVP